MADIIVADGLVTQGARTSTGMVLTQFLKHSDLSIRIGDKKITSRVRFNIKMSYQYRKSHCGDKKMLRSFYLHNWIFHTVKMDIFILKQPSFIGSLYIFVLIDVVADMSKAFILKHQWTYFFIRNDIQLDCASAQFITQHKNNDVSRHP